MSITVIAYPGIVLRICYALSQRMRVQCGTELAYSNFGTELVYSAVLRKGMGSSTQCGTERE
eukprot:2677577-Rhodomonas_salina.3